MNRSFVIGLVGLFMAGCAVKGVINVEGEYTADLQRTHEAAKRVLKHMGIPPGEETEDSDTAKIRTATDEGREIIVESKQIQPGKVLVDVWVGGFDTDKSQSIAMEIHKQISRELEDR